MAVIRLVYTVQIEEVVLRGRITGGVCILVVVVVVVVLLVLIVLVVVEVVCLKS